jgi:glycosyltransferase involved in cell wall biosynthesis
VSRWIWLATGLLLGGDWLRRAIAAAMGMGKLADVTRPEWDRFPRLTGAQPKVSVVVAARDEGKQIEQCLRSLVVQDYPDLEICAVDDRSSDRTATIMDQLRGESPVKVDVIHITELPPGWLGKTHAMWSGAAATHGDWILFTDGDIAFRADALRRTLSYAELTACDHLVIFPTLIMKTIGERMMLGFFGLAFSLLVRPWKARDENARDFVGAGAFNLIRRSAYETLGTYQALRMEVIDDLKLGESVKQHGFRQDCVLGHALVQLRWAEGAFGIVRNLQKNMFSLLRFNWGLVFLASIAAIMYHLGPWMGLILAPGVAKVGFAVAVFSVALLYAGMARQFGLSFWYMFTQPGAALMYVYTLLYSATSSVIHGGVIWRGTTYSITDIRLAAAESRGRKLAQRE